MPPYFKNKKATKLNTCINLAISIIKSLRMTQKKKNLEVGHPFHPNKLKEKFTYLLELIQQFKEKKYTKQHLIELKSNLQNLDRKFRECKYTGLQDSLLSLHNHLLIFNVELFDYSEIHQLQLIKMEEQEIYDDIVMSRKTLEEMSTIVENMIGMEDISKNINPEEGALAYSRTKIGMELELKRNIQISIDHQEYQKRKNLAKKILLAEGAYNFWQTKLDSYDFISYERFYNSFKEMYIQIKEENPTAPDFRSIMLKLGQKVLLSTHMTQVSFHNINSIFEELISILHKIYGVALSANTPEVFTMVTQEEISVIKDKGDMESMNENPRISECVSIRNSPMGQVIVAEEEKVDIGIEEEKEIYIEKGDIEYERIKIRIKDGENGDIKEYEISSEITSERNFYVGSGGNCYLEVLDKEVSKEQCLLSMSDGEYFLTCTAKGGENITTYELPHKQRLLLTLDAIFACGSQHLFQVTQCNYSLQNSFLGDIPNATDKLAQKIKGYSKLVLRVFEVVNEVLQHITYITVEASGDEYKTFILGRGKNADYSISKEATISRINSLIIHEEGKWYLADGDYGKDRPYMEDGMRLRTCFALNTRERNQEYLVSPPFPLAPSNSQTMTFHAGRTTIWVPRLYYIYYCRSILLGKRE